MRTPHQRKLARARRELDALIQSVPSLPYQEGTGTIEMVATATNSGAGWFGPLTAAARLHEGLRPTGRVGFATWDNPPPYGLELDL